MTGAGASAAVDAHRRVGRYELFMQIAKGGMATVHLGRVVGAGRFARAVAIKRLHEQYAGDAEFRQMFLNEAEVLARVRHPCVVPTLDLIEQDEALFIVMEFIEGVTLRQLQTLAGQRSEVVPWNVALSVLEGALRGLHAAHEARNEHGEPLDLVHRDVSPDNILVGADGLARVFDFGIAKALGKVQTTQDGQVKGKVPYMTPEQLLGEPVTRRSDVFAAAIVLWETLTGRRLFATKDVGQTMHRLLVLTVPNPSTVAPHVPKALDPIVRRGLERDPAKRYASAAEMADAFADAGPLAPQSEVAAWVKKLAAGRLAELAEMVRTMERTAPLATGERAGAVARRKGAKGSAEGASPDGAGSASTSLALAVDSTSTARMARRRRRRFVFLGAGLAGAAVVAALVLVKRSGDGANDAGASPTEPPSAVGDSASAATPTPAPEASTGASALPSSTAVAAVDSSSATSASARPSSAPGSRPTAPTKPKPSGSPLYGLD